ncbi:TPA: Bro-N domain-containing protein [Pseudomonas aeruginosa]|nr:Bro-N domain-containing protein [Pseudomonas aeruginosa]
MNLISYSFKNRPVRVVTDENGEPWFVGKDVCELLGYADSINAIKQHCRGVVKYHPIPDSLGRMQQTRLLSEPDTLRLIVNSQLPAAQEFERWVFEDVLPSIRRTGSYSIGQQLVRLGQAMQNPNTKLGELTELVQACGVDLRICDTDKGRQP